MKLIRYPIAFVVLAFSSFAYAADALKVIPPEQKVLSSANGRFVFGQISGLARDQFMLDTQTGRLWQIVLSKPKNPDGTEVTGDGFIILDPVPYRDIGGKLGVTPR